MSAQQRKGDGSTEERDEAVLTRVRTAAELLCRYRFATWSYGDSVGFEGLLAASDLLGEARYEGFVHGAAKTWIGRGDPFRELDNTAPGHAFCILYECTGDKAVLDGLLAFAERLMERRTIGGAFVSFERAPLRTPYGGERLSAEEQRLVDDPGAGVFVDTLHFDAPFLTHLGALTGERGLLDAGAGQAGALAGLLQQQDGLFAHFHLERTGRTYGYGWGRGQGWALLGLLDVLEYLPGDHPLRAGLLGALQRLAGALAASQTSDGHWPTPIEDRESFHETTTALFVAAGFSRGVSAGLLDPSLLGTAERAWQAGLDRVGADGRIEGVSAALWAATVQSHYSRAPLGQQVPWGQGPFLLAAREHLDLPAARQHPDRAVPGK